MTVSEEAWDGNYFLEAKKPWKQDILLIVYCVFERKSYICMHRNKGCSMYEQ